MARIEKTLSVEKKLESSAAKRDTEVLGTIASALPSASRVKIYKKEEDGKSYISSISAEDFQAAGDPHEYVKKKYVPKHGPGEYQIELLDSDGNAVDKRVISIAGESQAVKSDNGRPTKIMEDALTMREDAFEKVKEATDEKSKAEKMKYETMMLTLNNNWETMQKMYESQIKVLTEQKDSAPDKTGEILVQMQIDKINRDFEHEREKFESQLRDKEEGSASSDKMFDLVSTLIPLIISKSNGEKHDPIEELNKTINLVTTLTGGKKDIIESMLESPERMKMFQKILGVDESNSKNGGFMEDILENPAKAEMFKKLLGIDEKKDFITDLMENPAKFEIFKKVTGMDKQEQFMREIAENSKMSTPIEQPKSFIDDLVESHQKFELMKGIFSPSQPAKTFMEFLSTVVTGAAPHLVSAVNTFVQGQITMEMIRNKMISKDQLPDINGMIQGQNGYGSPQPQNVPTKQKDKDKNKEVKELNIEDAFEQIVVRLMANSKEEMEGEQFVIKVADAIILNVKRKPSLMLSIMKYGGIDGITSKMSDKLRSILGVDEEIALSLSNLIADKVKSDFIKQPEPSKQENGDMPEITDI